MCKYICVIRRLLNDCDTLNLLALHPDYLFTKLPYSHRRNKMCKYMCVIRTLLKKFHKANLALLALQLLEFPPATYLFAPSEQNVYIHVFNKNASGYRHNKHCAAE